MASGGGVPRGLRFFTPGTPRRQRVARLWLAVVLLLGALALVWPIYAVFGGIRPLVLGLPLSFAWVIFWVLAVFVALIAVYRVDHPRRQPGEGGGSGSGGPSVGRSA